MKAPVLIFPVYRRLGLEAHANEFARGRVFLSTMGAPRDPDHPAHDPEEGSHRWRIPNFENLRSSRELEEGRRKLALGNIHLTFADAADPATFVARGNMYLQARDAYVLYLSRDPDLIGFGPYCFKIHNFMRFSRIVGRELSKLHGGCAVDGSFFPGLAYGRESGGDAPPNPLGVGTVGFEGENECRLTWEPRTHGHIRLGDLKPLLLDAPALRTTFKRLS